MNEKHILLQIDEIRNMTFIEDKNDARLCENLIFYCEDLTILTQNWNIVSSTLWVQSSINAGR